MRKSVVAEKRRVQAIRRYYADLREKYAKEDKEKEEALVYYFTMTMDNYDNSSPEDRKYRQQNG
jgi:hypothetical protein